MQTVQHASLFTIVGEEDGKIVTSAGGWFDTVTYSRFKYGDLRAADRYGQLLAGAILGRCVSKATPCDLDSVIVTASAYKLLPTAAQAAADSAIQSLHGYGYPVQSGRIHRDILTEGDYGNMSTDERAYWMSCNGLWVDEAEFERRHVIVIDDVNISGAHGKSIVKLFESIDVQSLTLVHVLKLDSELAARDPKIEDRMNHVVIKDLWDLYKLIQECPGYTPNARTVKFVLSRPIPEIEEFLLSLTSELVYQIHVGVQADEYDRMRSYKAAAEYISRHAMLRRLAAQPQMAD